MHNLLSLQIRGVRVGSTMRVEPSLERVDVLVEVTEPTTVIPRNALIEANQSGLIAEPLIDITPQTPIPDWKVTPPAVLHDRQLCGRVPACNNH
jgi:ABC-type transporter Mla subunit MlaD